MIVGFVACTVAITCVWLLPEMRGKVIIEPGLQREPELAGSRG
jgi:hypothetical protein